MQASDRPKQAQHLSTCRKVQWKLQNPSGPLIPGGWVSSVDLSYAHIPFQQSSRKYLTQFLGWIINQEKSELKPTQVFPFMGYEYYLDSALVRPSQRDGSNLKDLILPLKVKTCFECKMFDVANWVACLNGENGPGGMPSHEALSVSPQ